MGSERETERQKEQIFVSGVGVFDSGYLRGVGAELEVGLGTESKNE